MNRVLWHVGASLSAYCTLVAIRAGDFHNAGAAEYAEFHPYIAAWLLGLNLSIYAFVETGRARRWF